MTCAFGSALRGSSGALLALSVDDAEDLLGDFFLDAHVEVAGEADAGAVDLAQDVVVGAVRFGVEHEVGGPNQRCGVAAETLLNEGEFLQEVIDEVEAAGHGIGSLDGFDLAVTRAQALAAFDDFLQQRLPNFGAYEDAMSQQHQTLFHSILSPYLNLGLLEPMELIQAAEMAYTAGDAPINSVEGFVRQILGWREYIYWQYWRQMPEIVKKNSWDAKRPLPTFFWDANTDMNCLHQVIERAIGTGYNHHIERLMVLCNFCLLAGIEPMAVNDWFLAHYIDAYEWVMLPNVLGMGLNADGGVTATKPYIASANYINKMGDYCGGCRFNRKQRYGEDACPFNFLYWNFLLQHEETLRANPRLGPNVLGLRYLDDAERTAVRQQAKQFLAEEIGR